MMASEKISIQPTKFGLKYDPAKLGVQYNVVGKKNSKHLHEISLSHIRKDSNVERAVDELIRNNMNFLHPKAVSREQVRRPPLPPR